MHTYTNVVFDRYEQQALEAAGRHLGVAYPDFRTEVPRNPGGRLPDHEARVVWHLVRDVTQGTHENCTRAVAVVEHLTTVLDRESDLDFWLDDTERSTGTRPTFSEEPTSDYQNLRVLSEIREDQLRDATRALSLLRRAVQITSPRTPDDIETDSFGDTATV